MFGKKKKKNHSDIAPVLQTGGAEPNPAIRNLVHSAMTEPVVDKTAKMVRVMRVPVEEEAAIPARPAPNPVPAPVVPASEAAPASPSAPVIADRKMQYDLMPLAIRLDESVDRSGALLCTMPISESEFFGLVDYMQCTFGRLMRQVDPEPDLLFTVGLVQSCIRFYNGHFASLTNRIARMLQAGDQLTQEMLEKISLMVLATLDAYEKPYRMDGHLPKNLLMHAFITDKDYFNLFEYLLLFYHREIEADIRRLDDCMMNALCKSMIHPFDDYAHLLSRHFAESIRTDADSCKKMLRLLIRMIDYDFYEHPLLQPDPDGGRLRSIFEKWKKTSKNYTLLVEEMRSRICDEGVRPEDKREPYLLCDPQNGGLEVVLPSQLVFVKKEEDRRIRWYVSAKYTREIPLPLRESVIGYRTDEIILPISVKESLQHLTFVLMIGDRKVCRFSWPSRSMNFFNEDGRGIRIRRLTPGKRIAYGDPSVDLTATCPVSEKKVNGFRFFTMDLKEGDIVTAGDRFSLYVGSIEKNHLTKSLLKYACNACYSEGERVGVYNRVPSLAVLLKEGDVLNTNGHEKSAVMDGTIQVLSDSKDVLSLLKAQDAVMGMNRVLLKSEEGSVKASRKFVLFKDFEIDFQDAPYAGKGKGILIMNRPMCDGVVMIEEQECRTAYAFDLSECLAEHALHIPVKAGKEEIFDVEIGIPYMKQLWN